MPTFTPCLWFDGQAEEAAKFYVSIFKDSKMGAVSHYSEAGQEVHGQKPGTVLTVEFEILGQKMVALNGGPHFKFSEAVSFMVNCDTQEEIDRYWDRLSAGGDEDAQQCGWLKDKYGLSWQIIPKDIDQMVVGTSENSQRAMKAMLEMKKIDMAKLKRAYEGR